MKESGRLLLVVLGICLAVGAAQATPVAITNPGFEDPDLADGGYQTTIPGWTIAYGSAGEFDVSGDFSQGGYGGENVAYTQIKGITGALFGQTVGTIAGNTRYTLTAKVGDRDTSGYDTNWPTGGGSYIYARLNNGTVWLTPVSSDTPTPVNGGFATWTMVYEVPTGSDLIGDDIIIYLGCSGSEAAPATQVQFDDVTLDASPIPEPATMTLLAMGIGGILLKRRR